jgi:hypothetical protein
MSATLDVDGRLPQAVLDHASSSLQHFLIPMFIRSERPVPDVDFVGSGTLVEIEGSHHILTAAHVWNKAKDATHVGLSLTTFGSRFMVPRDRILSKQEWRTDDPGWGPDLALLRLPSADVPRIKAHKSFLNFPQQRAAFADRPPDTTRGYWAVTGMVGEFSNIERDREANRVELRISGRAVFSVVREVHERERYDYIDIGVRLELPGTPSTFRGVSGGGLWEIQLVEKSGTIQWNGKPHLRGVAFWESAPSGDRCVIRCHGPRSIFERAWELWELPQQGGAD